MKTKDIKNLVAAVESIKSAIVYIESVKANAIATKEWGTSEYLSDVLGRLNELMSHDQGECGFEIMVSKLNK